MKRKFHTLLTLAVTCGLASFAGADLVATDLNIGGTDTGFSGDWIGSVNRFIITAPDLTYPNYGITQTGTTERVFGGNNTHPDRMKSRNLESAMSGEIWFSVLVNVPEGGGFAGLAFDTDTTVQGQVAAYSHNASELRVLMTPSELWVDWTGAGTNATWTPDATVGGFSAGTHLILGQMTVGVGADSLNIWVNPDVNAAGGPGGLPAATYSNSTIDFADSIMRIGVPLRVSGLDTADAIWMSDTATAFEDVTGVVPSSATFQLIITPNGSNPGSYDFSWNSLPGKLYDLLTSTDLADPIADWPIYDDGATVHASIPSAGSTTTLPDVPSTDPRRFFALRETTAPPPPPIFSADFEAGGSGFTQIGTPNDWSWGTPNSNNDALLVLTTGNNGSTGAWATNLGTGGTPSGLIDTAADSILRSPDIDLTGITAAQLSFAAAYDAQAGDVIQVLVRDAGTDALLDTINPVNTAAATSSDWTTLGPFDLSAADNTNIYLEFRYTGTDGTFIGLYLDDVTVSP